MTNFGNISFVAIVRMADDKIIHQFHGDSYDEAVQVFNQMCAAYSRLPEFSKTYCKDTYVVRRVYFENAASLLDRYR